MGRPPRPRRPPRLQLRGRARARRSAAGAALAVLAALSLAACGGPPSEDDDARGAVETLLLGCAEGEPGVVLESLTPPARAAFARGGSTVESCAEALGLDLSALSPAQAAVAFEEARVTEVTSEGGFAKAVIEVAGQRREVEGERVGSRWLVVNPEVRTG